MTIINEFRHLPPKEGDEQRGNMSAINIGIRHDDHALVTQIILAIMIAGAAPKRLQKVRELLIGHKLVARGRGDIEDLAPQRENGLRRTVTRLFGRATGRVTLNDEDFRTGGSG